MRQLTSQDHNFWSNCRNFNFFSVLQTRHPKISKDIKISSIKIWEDIQICYQSQNRNSQTLMMSTPTRRTFSGRQPLVTGSSKSHNTIINTPRPPNLKKKKKKKQAVLKHFPRQILSLFPSKFSPKHIKKPLISLFFQQSRGSSCTVFPLLGLRTIDLRF